MLADGVGAGVGVGAGIGLGAGLGAGAGVGATLGAGTGAGDGVGVTLGVGRGSALGTSERVAELANWSILSTMTANGAACALAADFAAARQVDGSASVCFQVPVACDS